MPFYKELKLLSTNVYIWNLTESDKEIADFLNVCNLLIDNKFEKGFMRQTYAWQYLLKYILNDEYKGVYKDEAGKPFLIDSKLNIAVSHSRNWIVIAINGYKNVGIDIEMISDKIDRVKHKFLSDLELQFCCDSETLTKAWCAKEAFYKLNGKKGVSLKNDINLIINNEDDWGVKYNNKPISKLVDFKIENYIIVLSEALS